MEALVARLSQLDAHVEGALRVVMFYDTLISRRVDLPALARASAGLAECVVGIRLEGVGRTVRVAPDGTDTARPPSPASTTATVTLDAEAIGEVWLERPAPPGQLDQLLLDRLAIAVAAVVERYGPARTTMADPALVELVIGDRTDEAARTRALRLLGFAPDVPVRVVAVRTRRPLDRLGTRLCPARPVKAATVAGVGVILATTVDATRFPDDVLAGIGAADVPHRSWLDARTALRFAGARRPVVHHDELGALALLAHLPVETLAGNPDVGAVAALAERPDDLETLDVYCATGSLRRAAELLHLHHSSVARRLDLIGKGLGFALTDPEGLLRAGLALTAWRLLDA